MKNLKITVNGKTYDVQVEEASENKDTGAKAVPINEENFTEKKVSQGTQNNAVKLNLDTSGSQGEPVKAPMPGTIVSVNVSEGQNVQKGTVLLVLEAMKMENEIVSPRDAVVTHISVKKGESVESGSSLVYLK